MDLSSLDLNDDKTCFRLGFLQRCLEEKLSAEQLDDRIKRALDTGTLALAGLAAPFAGGMLAGGFTGHAIGKATNPPDPDVESERLKELADMYKIQAARMRARRAIKYRPPASGR